jgi:hypothetical protein
MFNLSRYGYTVRALAKPDYRQHDQQLKFTKIDWLWHFFDYTEEIDAYDHRTEKAGLPIMMIIGTRKYPLVSGNLNTSTVCALHGKVGLLPYAP